MKPAGFFPNEPVKGRDIPKVEDVVYLNEATANAKRVDDANVLEMIKSINTTKKEPTKKYSFTPGDSQKDAMKERFAALATQVSHAVEHALKILSAMRY